MAAAPILALPLDIISSILKVLSQAEDLLSAACSHSIFYAAIKQNEDIVCEAVSLNFIDYDLYPYALAAYYIRSRPFDEAFLYDVLFDMHYRIFEYPSRGTRNFKCHASLRSALHISNLQQFVFYFNLQFEGETMMRAGQDLCLDRSELQYPVSSDEIFLIQRALYRFQIYCEIAMAASTNGSVPRGVFNSSICGLFLGYLPPWANEQLGCVHDCLEQFLLANFGRVAEHDVEWGAREMAYPPLQDSSPYVRGMLTYGLRFLHKVDTAGTYDEIKQALTSVPLAYSQDGLDYLLKLSQPWRLMNIPLTAPTGTAAAEALGEIVPQITQRAFEFYCKKMDAELPRCADCEKPRFTKHHHTGYPRALDVDCAWRFPFRMWRIAHQEMPLQETSYHGSLRLVRLTGYLLWDQCEDSVDEVRVADEINHMQHLSVMHYSERAIHGMGQRTSWKERTEIYQKGGRGYWSQDDVSAIDWTDATVDDDGIERLRKDFKDMSIPQEWTIATDDNSTSQQEESVPNTQ